MFIVFKSDFLKVPNVVHRLVQTFKLVVMVDNTHFDKQYKEGYYFLIMAFSSNSSIYVNIELLSLSDEF